MALLFSWSQESNGIHKSDDGDVCNLRSTIPLRLDRKPPCRLNQLSHTPVTGVLTDVHVPVPVPISGPHIPIPPPLPSVVRSSNRRDFSFWDHESPFPLPNVGRRKSPSSGQQTSTLHTILENEEFVLLSNPAPTRITQPSTSRE